MKKILYTLAVVLAGCSIQSCSLHDDNDFFGKPAAERLEETVKADKQLLESASNGWKLIYYTGEEYSGGGYTYLLKFQDGTVTAAGDMAEDAQVREKSSYDIITDESAVLSFNTHNALLHKFATPNSNSIDGEEGDYEFVIEKTTNDSIWLKGRKWGNTMLMTRMPEKLDWTTHLDSIMKVSMGIDEKCYNNRLKKGNDSIAVMYVDDYTRRAVLKVRRGLEMRADSIAVPYYVTTTGIQLQKPYKVDGVTIDAMAFDRDQQALHLYMNSENMDVESFRPVGYQPISFFIQNAWTLISHAAQTTDDDKILETETVKEYRVEFTPYNAIYLKGKINVDGYLYELYFGYDRKNGGITLAQQYADDPAGTYAYVNLAPVSFKDNGHFSWTGYNQGIWNEKSQMVEFTPVKGGDYAPDSYVFLACQSSGQPVYENGNLVSVAQITFVKGMKIAK